MGGLRHGSNGVDVNIDVPVGTQVVTGADSPRVVADLNMPWQRERLARGGLGGRGNARFASSTNRFPVLAEEGERGQELRVRLELKLLADVGIIGAPNAGKSSLLAAVSGARPKIAEYAFTTLEPVLGVVEWRNESFVMVDIPGLIEGAHRGVGLGHEFLRHIERTRVLIHIVDGSSPDPVGDYRRINEELRLFGKELLGKPQVVAINKIDIPEVRQRAELLKSELSAQDVAVYVISAAGRVGLDILVDGALQLLKRTREHGQAGQSERVDRVLPVIRPKPGRADVSVSREDGTFVVDMPAATRMAAMVDENDWNARLQFYRHLKRLRVVRALERAGIGPGDMVRIGKLEWEWD